MKTLTIRRPQDVADMVPHLFGFEPADSLVLITIGAFHARVDLPFDPAEVADVAETLIRPCQKHKVERVILAAYSESGYDDQAEQLIAAFNEAGVDVSIYLRISKSHMFGLDGSVCQREMGPLGTEMVVAGSAPLPSRQALAASLEQSPTHVTHAEVDAVADEIEVDHATARELRDLAMSGQQVDVPALLAALMHKQLRDAAWSGITRENAKEQVEFWREIVREAPRNGPAINAPAALLAFAAWLAGNGALAWCAVDVAEPGYRMAELIGGLLHGAVNPSTWEPMDFDEILLAI